MNHKKKMVWNAACLVMVFLMAGTAWAQPPDTISYQGFLTDSSGTPVNTSVNMSVGFYDVSSGGTASYAEDHSGVTVSNGQFNIQLGMGSATSGTWAGVDFSRALWIEVTAGGETLSPRIPLSAVSYARYAFIVADGSISASKLKGSIGDGTVGQVLSSNGSGGFTWASAAGVRLSPKGGVWRRTNLATAAVVGDVWCLPGTYPIAGGCDCAGQNIKSSGPVDGMFGLPVPDATPADAAVMHSGGWQCICSAAVLGLTVHALCAQP